MTARLGASDNARLLELIGDTRGLLEIDEFRSGLLQAVRRAVPADWISLNDIGPDPGQVVALVEPEIEPALLERFAQHVHENPLVARYARTRDGRVLRFSDVTSTEELHALKIYQEFYKPLGVEYQLAFTLPHGPNRILGVALARVAGDFTDAERDLLETARRFLIQDYRIAIQYSELKATRTAAATPALPELRRLIALGLTSRQAQILQLLARGAAEREIAAQLKISHRTVQKHLEHCYRQLGVNDRSSAAEIAWSTST